MKTRTGAFTIAALVLLALPGATEAQSVSGEWQVRWAQAVRIENDGSVTIQKWGDAVLTLEQEGDSVSGTWTTNVNEEVNWTVRGTFANGRLRLEATEHDSENPELAVVRSLGWDGRLEAGVIEGETWLVFERMARDPARRPFSAERRGGRAP